MNEEEIKNRPVLVYGNKQVLNSAYSESEIAKILGMEKLANRKWLVKGASIFTWEGIKEGFDWLASTIINKNENKITYFISQLKIFILYM